MQHEPIVVRVLRGNVIESRHEVVAAVANAHGEIVERYGDADFVTCWRSAAKPFQAQPWIEMGVIDHFGWGPEEIAIVCSSHDGTPLHADLVRRMLADIGLSEADLRCDEKLKARHNCSGNHTGFLAASVFRGWDVASYQQPDHPAQRAALEVFARCVELPEEQIPLAVDGCGIVVYATPVSTMARTWARLPELLPRQAAAMRAHPVLVEGEGLLDTVVMQAFPGVTSKCGAEGLGCASLPDGRGIAVKALDGGDRATDPPLIELITHCLGLPEVPEHARRLARPANTNNAGRVIGELVAVLPD